MNIQDYDWDRLLGLGFAEDTRDSLKKACWKGYEAIGVKKKGGRTVPNCVKVDSKHSERFNLNRPSEVDDMAIGNALPKVPATGPVKNPEMSEVGVRMPRMEVLKKANERDGHLAMAAAPNYNEWDPFDSNEPNGRMILTQLQVMAEKIDSMLSMIEPDDNLEPWVSTKIANSAMALSAVADYLRFGGETQ